MNLKDFNNAVNEQINICKTLLIKKGKEYDPVPDENDFVENEYRRLEFDSDALPDRLKDFKQAAVLMNTTPKAALFGMLTKHLVSVSNMCTDKANYSQERWDEKITDSINYLLILSAMIKEEFTSEKH